MKLKPDLKVFLLLSVLVLAVYGATLGYGYTSFDDYKMLVNHAKELQSLTYVGQAFRTDALRGEGVMYRPMLLVSLIINTLLLGASPFSYHLGNILIHLACCFLLYLFLRSLGVSLPPAGFLAALFAVHPTLTMAVAWVPGRNDSLLALFALASVIALVRYVNSGKWYWYLIQVAATMAALFTKESAVFLLVILGGLLVIKKTRDRRFMAYWPIALAWAGCLAVWYLMREAIIAPNEALQVTVTLTLREVVASTLSYIGKAFFPFRLAPFPGINLTDTIIGLAATAVCFMAVLRWRMVNTGLFVLGAFWFLLFLLPTLFVLLIGEKILLEHRLYLPAMGLMLAASQLKPLAELRGDRLATKVILLLVCAALSAQTVRYGRTFTNSIVFWKTAVIKSPYSSLARSGLGYLFIHQGKYDEAEEQLRLAVALNPTNQQASMWFADLAAYRYQADSLKRREWNLQVKTLNPTMQLKFKAFDLLKQGKYTEAADLFSNYLAKRPHDGQAQYMLALAYTNLGNFDGAAIRFRRALILGVGKEETAFAWFNLGSIYKRNKMADEAKKAFDSVFVLKPEWRMEY